MRPGGHYEAVQDLDNRLGVSFVHFVVRDEPGFAPPFEVTDVRSVDFAAGLLAEVVRWAEEDRALAERLLGDLLRVLTRDHIQAQAGSGERVGGFSAARRRREQEMRGLATRIMEEPGQAWRVGELAREAGMATDHFSRVFAEVLGERPQAFVVHQRMLRARQLLLESHLQIGEIAHLLGFRDVFYFSRQFRAHAGVPPSVLRRQAGR
jgi:AraC-like DNA-binding protein